MVVSRGKSGQENSLLGQFGLEKSGSLSIQCRLHALLALREIFCRRKRKVKRTPLTEWHEAHGARMTDFHGWRMPLQYASITDEHIAVRTKAGLFDLGHMGRVRISGPDRVEFVRRIVTCDIGAAAEGRVLYGFICNERGGIVDDVTVYRARDYIFLVVNASNRAKVLDHLGRLREGFSVEIEDLTGTLGMIAIQGPEAAAILAGETDLQLDGIKFYHFEIGPVAGAKTIVSRTGYTGEDGFELYMGSLYCESVWEALLARGRERGLVPVGLGARDTLRLEAAMPLYGNELDEETTPYEAGLGKFVALDKGDFIGRQALLERSRSHISRRLSCLVMQERSVPRSGYEIFVGDMKIGRVTSGTFSPTLGRGIAMAYLDAVYAQPDTMVEVEIRGRRYQARVIRCPFYSRRRKSK